MSFLKGKLKLILVDAKLDIDVESFGNQDPYAIFTIGQASSKSTVKDNAGKTPVWNETFNFTLYGGDEWFTFEIRDHNVGTDTMIGRTSLRLDQTFIFGPRDVEIFALNGRKVGSLRVAFDLDGNSAHLNSVSPAHGQYPQQPGFPPQGPPQGYPQPPYGYSQPPYGQPQPPYGYPQPPYGQTQPQAPQPPVTPIYGSAPPNQPQYGSVPPPNHTVQPVAPTPAPAHPAQVASRHKFATLGRNNNISTYKYDVFVSTDCVGGAGGETKHNDESTARDLGVPTRVKVTWSQYIYSIVLTHDNVDVEHGNTSTVPGVGYFDVDTKRGDYITTVETWTGDFVYAIRFTTLLGKQSEVFGDWDARHKRTVHQVTDKGHKFAFVGLESKSGHWLDSIMPFFGYVPLDGQENIERDMLDGTYTVKHNLMADAYVGGQGGDQRDCHWNAAYFHGLPTAITVMWKDHIQCIKFHYNGYEAVHGNPDGYTHCETFNIPHGRYIKSVDTWADSSLNGIRFALDNDKESQKFGFTRGEEKLHIKSSNTALCTIQVRSGYWIDGLSCLFGRLTKKFCDVPCLQGKGKTFSCRGPVAFSEFAGGHGGHLNSINPEEIRDLGFPTKIRGTWNNERFLSFHIFYGDREIVHGNPNGIVHDATYDIPDGIYLTSATTFTGEFLNGVSFKTNNVSQNPCFGHLRGTETLHDVHSRLGDQGIIGMESRSGYWMDGARFLFSTPY